jgi:hypothetical protein
VGAVQNSSSDTLHLKHFLRKGIRHGFFTQREWSAYSAGRTANDNASGSKKWNEMCFETAQLFHYQRFVRHAISREIVLWLTL